MSLFESNIFDMPLEIKLQVIETSDPLTIFSLCVSNKDFYNICKKNKRFKQKLKDKLKTLSKNNKKLERILIDLVITTQITNENSIQRVIKMIQDISKANNMYQNKGVWIYTSNNKEDASFLKIQKDDNIFYISSNKEPVIKNIIEKYFNVSSVIKGQSTYNII